jgi:cardiolipin synthase
MKEKKWFRVVFRRRVFVILILLIQIAFILYLIANSSRYSQFVGWALNVVSVVVCVHIINKNEISAYKLTWVFLIMLFPIFGGLLYIIFYFQSRPRKLQEYFDEINQQCTPLFLLPGDSLPSLVESDEDCLPQARYLQECAGFPIYVHTRTEYFSSGEDFLKKVLVELEKAEQYIFLEFFILREGQMLDPILEILERKACSGVDVRLIYDDLGCFLSLPSDFKQRLEKRQIRCSVFNLFKPVFSSLQNNRDHRKIISIDGKVAFTGGLNLSDEYINVHSKYGHWKDAAIMIEGAAAWSLTLIFLRMWNIGQKEWDDYGSFYPWQDEPCPVMSDGYVQPYADSPLDSENVGEHVYLQIINKAKDYLYINTPYLVVDDNILSALVLAAKSGVDVRIITPHRWDKWFVRTVSRSYYRRLIQGGVKVHEYTGGFNHSKTFVSDDKVATVGTINLDYRSLYLHFECGVWIYKNSAVMDVKKDFLNTIPVSKQISLKDCVRGPVSTVLRDVLRIFAPLM